MNALFENITQPFKLLKKNYNDYKKLRKKNKYRGTFNEKNHQTYSISEFSPIEKLYHLRKEFLL